MIINKLEPLEIVFLHYGKIYLTWRWRYHQYWNSHFEEMWHNRDEWAICVGFNPKAHGWFKREELEYDGMKSVMVSIFGICFGRSYGYYCDRLYTKTITPNLGTPVEPPEPDWERATAIKLSDLKKN